MSERKENSDEGATIEERFAGAGDRPRSQPQPQPQPQPRLRFWLLLSILLNVFLVGGIGGGAWRWWSESARADRVTSVPAVSSVSSGQAPGVGHGAAQAQLRGLRFAADGLPPAQRQAFRTSLREVRRASAELARSSREGRAEVARLLAAPQFDRGAIDAALARTRVADLTLRERVEGDVVGFAAGLSPADRATLVQGLIAQQGAFHVPAAPTKP